MSEDESPAASGGVGRRVAGAAGLLAGSVLLARLLGYGRDALFASEVGVGPEADAYFAAFMIPDILGYLLAAGAAAIAVTPPYLKRLELQGPEAAARFASVVVGNVGLFAIASTILLWLAAEPLLRLQFPDFDEATLAETVRLMRIVLPAQIFFLTGGVLRGVLMAHGRFGPQAMASVVYSAAPILGGLAMNGADGFAWGTVAGAAIGQWLIPVLVLRRLPGAVGRVRVGIFDADFREYVWLALPLMLGVGLTTVDEWYEKWVGGTLAVGAIASITYARKLMMAPVGVVGQAVGAALLPSLTSLHQRGEAVPFKGLLTRSLGTTLGLGVLAAGALGVLADPAVRFLYERGRFVASDGDAVVALLQILVWAIPGWVVQQVAVRGFYARGEMARAMALSTGIALAVFPLYWLGGQARGIEGLALASVAAITLNAVVTITWLRARSGAPEVGVLVLSGLRASLIAGLASAAAYFGADAMGLAGTTAWIRLAVGGVIYGGVALLGVAVMGDRALREGIGRMTARLRRS